VKGHGTFTLSYADRMSVHCQTEKTYLAVSQVRLSL